MITERELVEGHGSFWQTQTPSMSRLVRSLNLAGREIFDAPMSSTASADRIFLINEVAFELSASTLSGSKSSMAGAIEAANRSLQKIENIDDVVFDLTAYEQAESIELGDRIMLGIPDYIKYRAPFRYRPFLKGLGAVLSAEADLEFGNTLVEVKSGDRKIRSIDIRQIIIYYILSGARVGGRYKDCYIVNPRQGIRIYFDFDTLIAALSAKPPVEFTASFSDYLIDWTTCV